MRGRITFVSLLTTVILSPSRQFSASNGASAASPFVARSGSVLALNGAPYYFAGANNYYMIYKSAAVADDVLSTAAANGGTVLRVWAFLDIGDASGSGS